MLRAEDRLAEADFFLGKVEESGGRGREFRYYFAALARATRSISLVLQADLRSAHASRFDSWWEEKKASLPPGPISFDGSRAGG